MELFNESLDGYRLSIRCTWSVRMLNRVSRVVRLFRQTVKLRYSLCLNHFLLFRNLESSFHELTEYSAIKSHKENVNTSSTKHSLHTQLSTTSLSLNRIDA